MPRFAPYAAHDIAMLSSTPGGSGLPIGLMPGALPSDHASRQTLKTTAMRFLPGQSQSTCVIYSILSPIAFTTLAYFSVSLLRYAAARSGEDGAGSTPMPA